VQVPQLNVPPQPSEIDPQFLPCTGQVVGVQIDVVHAPAVQLCPAAHTCPHAPQLLGLVKRLVSQPSAIMPLQLPKPALHVAREQRPPTHDEFAFGEEHTWPHPPQLRTSVVTVVQTPPHKLWPAGQPGVTQLPVPSQTAPPGPHTLPVGALLKPGVPLLQVALAHAVDAAWSASSTTLTTWPAPSHWFAWQSPDVLATTVPAGRFTPPETQAEFVVAHCPATQA
jgi:hypothetical protein